MSARPPTSTRYATLFPYTPLCRSGECAGRAPNPADPRYREPGDNPVGPVGQDDADARALAEAEREQPLRHGRRLRLDVGIARFAAVGDHRDAPLVTRDHPLPRSEEHTSELQSLMRTSYDVFCLKKKKITSSKQDIIIAIQLAQLLKSLNYLLIQIKKDKANFTINRRILYQGTEQLENRLTKNQYTKHIRAIRAEWPT